MLKARPVSAGRPALARLATADHMRPESFPCGASLWARICPSFTGKPPHVDDDMMDRMRLILSFCILGQLLSMSLASGASGPSDSAYSVYRSGMGWAAFLWALITWIVYEGFPLGLIPCLRDFSQLSSSSSEDTEGIPYDRVTEGGGPGRGEGGGRMSLPPCGVVCTVQRSARCRWGIARCRSAIWG